MPTISEASTTTALPALILSLISAMVFRITAPHDLYA
jgi:hypothetical protein